MTAKPISLGNISIADTASTSIAGQGGDFIIIGKPKQGSAAIGEINGMSSASIQIAGRWVGSIVLEYSMDGGTTWILSSFYINDDETPGSTMTGNGVFKSSCYGYTHFRARATAWTSGIAYITALFGEQPPYEKKKDSVSIVDPITSSTLKHYRRGCKSRWKCGNATCFDQRICSGNRNILPGHTADISSCITVACRRCDKCPTRHGKYFTIQHRRKATCIIRR